MSPEANIKKFFNLNQNCIYYLYVVCVQILIQKHFITF